MPFSNLLLVHFFFQFHTTSTVSKKLDVSVQSTCNQFVSD